MLFPSRKSLKKLNVIVMYIAHFQVKDREMGKYFAVVFAPIVQVPLYILKAFVRKTTVGIVTYIV